MMQKKVKLFVSYYENDAKVRDYFAVCYENITEFISALNEFEIDAIKIENKNCNFAYIDKIFKDQKNKKFLFIGYSHGDVDSLVFDGSAFIQHNLNDHYFDNSIFYTNSCLSARQLGDSIVKNGNSSFIGNVNKTWTFPPYNDIFINCENFAIKLFLKGEILKNAFDKMIANYNAQIDYLDSIDEIAASKLTINRDSLVLLGKKQISILDYLF